MPIPVICEVTKAIASLIAHVLSALFLKMRFITPSLGGQFPTVFKGYNILVNKGDDVHHFLFVKRVDYKPFFEAPFFQTTANACRAV